MAPEMIAGRFLYSQSEVDWEKKGIADRIRKQVEVLRDEEEMKARKAALQQGMESQVSLRWSLHAAYQRVLDLLKDGES